jgi:lipopolysaccharide export system protein LptA
MIRRRSARLSRLAFTAGSAGLVLMSGAALAQRAPQPSPAAGPEAARPSAIGNLGSNSKEPIKIDADRLDVFDKEGRAVFSGNVVAVQGDSTMRCSALTVFYEQNRDKPAGAPRSPTGQGDSNIRKIDCKGPVTVVSKTQTATGDRAEFDRVANKVILSGNVTLSEGPNLTKGERVVYDLNTSRANVEGAKPGDRVRATIVPGSQGSAPGPASAPTTTASPARPRPATN